MSDEMTQDDLQQDDSGRPYALYGRFSQLLPSGATSSHLGQSSCLAVIMVNDL